MNKNLIRIIPFLDIKNGLLIKGINLEGLRIIGKAENFSNFYYKSGWHLRHTANKDGTDD